MPKFLLERVGDLEKFTVEGVVPLDASSLVPPGTYDTYQLSSPADTQLVTAPSISGLTISPSSPDVGEVCTAVYTALGDGYETFYTWSLDDVVVGTDATYIPLEAGELEVTVRLSNSAGAVQATSSTVTVTSTGNVAPNFATVVISPSSPTEGQIMTVLYTFTTPPIPAATIGIQWKRNTVNISGATNSTKTVVSADVSNDITVTVTATNVAGSNFMTSSIVVPTGAAAPSIPPIADFIVTENTGIQNLDIKALSTNVSGGSWTVTPYVFDDIGGLTVQQGTGGIQDVHRFLTGTYTNYGIFGPNAVFVNSINPIAGITDDDLPAGYSMAEIAGLIHVIVDDTAPEEDPGRIYEVWAWNAENADSGPFTIVVEGTGTSTDISVNPEVPETIDINNLVGIPGETDLEVTGTTSSSITVDSPADTGQDRSVFYRETVGPGNWQRATATQLPITITGLDPVTSYEIDVGDTSLLTQLTDAIGPTNLLINGDFDTASDWSNDIGWAIVAGKLEVSTTALNNSTQGITIDTTKPHAFSFDASDYASGSFRWQLTGGTTKSGTTRSGNGSFTEYFLPNASNASFRFNAVAVTPSLTVKFDNAVLWEQVPSGINLISQNPGFAASTGWTFPAQWAIGSGIATLNEVGATSRDLVQAVAGLINGRHYRLTVNITTYAGGTLRGNLSGGTPGTIVNFPQSTGIHVVYLTAGTSNTGLTLDNPSAAASLSIDDVFLELMS